MVLTTMAADSVARTASEPQRIRGLVYHRFANAACDPFAVAPDVFDAQMRWLADEGLAISLSDLEAFVRGEGTVPEGAVLVTIDDGFQTVLDVAGPIMKKYGIPSIAYVSSDLVGRPSDLGPSDPYLDWEGVARLQDYGIVIGSHGHRHISLGEIGAQDLHIEAATSRELIEKRLGITVDSFAYPFGTQAHFNDVSRQVAMEAGYRTVFTAVHGSIVPGADLFGLPRVKVEGGETLWMFQQICRGQMDAWQVIDGAISLITRVRRSRQAPAFA
jgi:peptidoglycan/xylan/chitin deacetylase (PgdA/CDA1 family)